MKLQSALARTLVLVALTGFVASAGAWSNHALCTWQALSVLREFASASPLEVERLETFLAAEAAGLEQLLQQEEQWARKNVPSYPARPEALTFRAAGASPAELAQRFRAALRINPASRLTLFLQLPPGQGPAGRPTLAWTEVTTLKRHETTQSITFLALREGDVAPLIDVIATASDEPDYGFDFGLWEDNGTPHGKAYGLGKQAFGNPALEFSSQGPMHIGFYHEAAIVYKAAPFLKRTFPENYQFHRVRSATLRHDLDDAAMRALRDMSRDAAYTDDAPRRVVTRQAHALADALDHTLETWLPAKYISDPGYTFGESESGVDLNALLDKSEPAARNAMTAALSELLINFGAHTRAFVRALIASAPPAKA